YQDNGQWREAQEVIESFPDGAMARQGAHKVIFAPNLNVAGAVDLQMPDGQRVRSHVLGLAWWDAASGKGVLVAGVRDCVGKLLPPNQVLYEDAFEGLRAEVRYTYTRAGLEQDVILRECPPGPERFGLNPKTARLQVWTEFVEAPSARVEATVARAKDGGELSDVQVAWDTMAIGVGRAFAVGLTAVERGKHPDGESAEEAARTGSGSVRVSKQWVNLQGRQFLVEEVEWEAVRAAVEQLPAATAVRAAEAPVGPVAMWLPAAPAQRAAKRQAEPLQVAAVVPSGPGFVLDYVVLNTTQNNYLFRGDTTYYVSAQVNLNGTTTFEGGAVIKFRRNNAGLRLNGPWVCRTGPYRPVIFTAQDDNSVGETIAGSTGNPTGYYGNGVTLTKTGMLAQVRFSHLRWGIRYEPWSVPSNANILRLAEVQWVRCQVALRVVDAWCMVCGATVYVNNALVAECPTFLEGEEALVHARHLTVHQCSTLAQRQGGECSLAITNSILSAVTTLSGGGATVTTSHSASFTTSSPFQSVGAGHYYIAAAAENQIRNQGTVNIPAALLEALAQKTVFPPVVHQNIVWNQNTTLGPR
ncbi:MAG: hypothetical protein RMK20_15750, partial [Verrucomicrobiales bacterium]|nr:hypothetical protein [Verrucomicrobiales bacterium]